MKVIPMVKITQISEQHIEVNGKPVYKDMNGKWIVNQELTPAEQRSLYNHVKAIA